MYIFKVKATLKGRIGENDIESVRRCLRKTVCKTRAQGVLVVDVGIIDSMEHQVHGGDAEHGRIEIETMEHMAPDVLAVMLQQIAGIDFLGRSCFWIGFLDNPIRGGIVLQQVLHHANKEAASAAGRIANDIGGLGLQHIDHQPDDPRLLGYGRIAPASFTTVRRNGSPKARWRGSGCDDAKGVAQKSVAAPQSATGVARVQVSGRAATMLLP